MKIGDTVVVSWTTRHWPWVALIASAGMLAIAHGFETFGHLAPCELCLKQRSVYWLTIGLCAAGLVWRRVSHRFDPTWVVNILLVAAFLAEAGIAVYHAGAEWKFWPGPQSCSGGAAHVDPAALARLLSGAKMGIPACDKAPWVFLGLSMAGWNALIAAALASASAVAAGLARPPRGATR